LSENNEISKGFGIDVTCKPSESWPCTSGLHVTQRIQTENKREKCMENTFGWESERGEEVDDGDDDRL